MKTYIAGKTQSNTMRKLLTLSAAMLLLTNASQSQLLSKVLPPGEFSQSVSTIVENYSTNYHQIQGVPLPADEDRDIFVSTISLPGTSKCVIYRFHSEEDTTASWQAILYSGEDYKEAVKTYKNSFRQIKQTKFNVGITKVSFAGDMEPPSESLRFTSSILRPSVTSGIYKNFIAEVELLNSVEGWTVQLSLHSRKADDERYQ